MKKIAAFFEFSDALSHSESSSYYFQSYAELSHIIAGLGGQLYITREQKSYAGEAVFLDSWVIENNSLKNTGRVVVDVVYDKGRFKSDGKVAVFNCDKIKEVCNDKWSTYQHFSEYCPKTFFVESKTQLHSLIPQLSTDMVVFKPFSGGKGIGVKIEKKEYFNDNSIDLQFPAVISEFLDTSVGVPGIIDGLHDLRLALFDGEILYSYVRTPPQGSLLANVSKGGKFEMIDPTRLPTQLVDIAKKIDSKFSECGHRFYSIDFGYTVDGPKIIEMNSELGLLPNKEHPAFVTLKEKLAETFMDM